VLTHRSDLQGHFHEAGNEKALRDILRVGTSAGGARAKAVIAWNRETNEVRSGQVAAGDGFEEPPAFFNRSRADDPHRSCRNTEIARSGVSENRSRFGLIATRVRHCSWAR
jgi:hypothetical protein